MSNTQKTKLQKFVLVLGIVVSVAALALLACSIVLCATAGGNGYVGKFSPEGGDKPLLAYARFCNAIRKALFGGVDTYVPDADAVSSFIMGLACCILGVIWLVFAAVKKKFIHFLYFLASIAVGFVVSFGYFLGTENEAYQWHYLADYPLALVIYSFAYILFIAYVAFFVLNLLSLIKIKKAPKAEKEEEKKEEAAPAVEEKKEEPAKEEKPAEEVKAEEKPAEPVVAEQPKDEKVEETKPEEKPVEEPKEEKKEEEKPAPKKAPAAKKPAEKKEPAKKAEPKKEPAKKPEEKKEPAKKAEPKPAEKKEPAKKAEAKPAPKAAEKKEPAKKAEPKPAEKKEPAEAKRRAGAPSAYHIAQHPNGGWKVQGAKSEKALKIFPTQAEAIKYAKELSKNAGVPFRVHSRAGKIRKA